MAALANNKVNSALTFEPILADVETLNKWAIQGHLEITKLSYAALGVVRNSYGLLASGGALGRGCGPLIVGKPGTKLNQLPFGLIASPGELTTACLLLQLYLSKLPRVKHMVFSEIMPAVAKGEMDFGVIIHEGRFSFEQYGLDALLDLGQWWQEETGAPLPLGGIAVRRDIGPETAALVDQAIRDSIALADTESSQTMDYVLAHAQEMEQMIVTRHIELYVNEFSRNIGTEGKRAVEVLLKRAEDVGILPKTSLPLMAY